MHREDRRKASGRGTYPTPTSRPLPRTAVRRRTAFTLIELGVAVLIFTLIAGVATLAVARAQLSVAKDRYQRATESELTNLLAMVSSVSYDDLLEGSFVRPEACAEAAHKSCPTVLGRRITVTWDILALEDRADVSTENPAGLLLTARTTLPFGGEVARERFVPGKNSGREGTALTRVRLSGADHTGPVYLMTADNEVAGSAIATAMTATIRAAVSDCTSESPCRLALRPDGGAEQGGHTLDHLAVAGGIVLGDGMVTETAATIVPLRELQVMLLAENSDGRREWAPAPGSVCLYLRFPTPTGTVEEPACNTVSPDRIIWTGYRPALATLPDVRVALPADTAITVVADPSATPCGADGQLGWSGGAWTPLAVCTGWTWGAHSEIRDGITGDGAALSGPIALGSTGVTTHTAVWTPGNGYAVAATGRNGEALWAKPRNAPPCALTTECAPPTSNPETSCPNSHCNSTSNSAPVLTSPRRGSYRVGGVVVDAGETNEINLFFADTENDPVTVTVTGPVSGLSLDESPVTEGTVLLNGAASPAGVTLEFDPPPGFSAGELILAVSDGTSTHQERLLLTTGAPRPAKVIASPATLTQDGTTVVRAVVLGSDGELLSDGALSYSGPENVVAGSIAAVGNGTYTLGLSAENAARGTGNYTITAASVSASSPLTIRGTPGGITVMPSSHQQGEIGALSASVTDLSGSPLPGEHVWFRLSAGTGGTVPLGSYPRSRGCVTDETGVCSVALDVEQNAVVGSYVITAHAGNSTGNGNLTIASSIARVSSDGGVVQQGGALTIRIFTYNGRNEPAIGIPFTVSSDAAGVTVTGSGTTDANGEALLEVTVGTATPRGTVVIIVDDGVNRHEVRVLVTGTVTAVDAPATLTIARLGNAMLAFTARNAQGQPVPYARITLTAGDGIYLPASVMTDASGQANVALSATLDLSSDADDIVLSYQGANLASVDLTVLPAVIAATPTGTLASGTSATVRITLTGEDGGPVTGRALTLVPGDPRITLANPNRVTNSVGWASFLITVDGSVPGGFYPFEARFDGRVVTVSIEVSP